MIWPIIIAIAFLIGFAFVAWTIRNAFEQQFLDLRDTNHCCYEEPTPTKKGGDVNGIR